MVNGDITLPGAGKQQPFGATLAAAIMQIGFTPLPCRQCPFAIAKAVAADAFAFQLGNRPQVFARTPACRFGATCVDVLWRKLSKLALCQRRQHLGQLAAIQFRVQSLVELAGDLIAARQGLGPACRQ